MAMLLGKKVGMTQVYDESGKMLGVTVIQAGPCKVLQVKNTETDGYNALQLGYEEVKKSRRKAPEVGHAAKANAVPSKFVRELRFDGESPCNLGDSLTVSVFADTSKVDVIGTSKGKGYAGVMKRHGFGGFPASHGTERKHRAPGSISSFASDAGHGGNLKKGKRMSGHMGHERVTSKSLDVVNVDEDRDLLVVKGSVPGPSGGYLIIITSKKS